jgi:hypothetical protein
VTRTGKPSPCTPFPEPAHRLSGLVAGEAIAAGDVVYIKSSDGKVWLATGAANNEAADALGMAPAAASVGEAVSVYWACRFNYGPNVAGTATLPGRPLFLSGTVPGGLADAASVGGLLPFAIALDNGRIQIVDAGQAY